MKKHLLYAALFVGALSSCSKDNDRVSAPAGEENNDLEMIKLSVSGAEAFNVQTRGTGVVGGLEGNNNWNSQTLYVLMTDSGTVNNVKSEDAGYTYTNIPEYILWNVAVKAPSTVETGEITGNDGQPHFYYPIQGNFDFYGYHVDDAVQTPEPTATEDEKDLTLDVTIDGTQDLLVAKANWTEDVKDATGDFYPNAGGYKYGAYAARRGVQPTLSFQHLLTQLQFTVENKSKEYDITVKSIKVTSKTNATVTVAGEHFSSIVWAEDEENATVKPAELEVKQKAADGEEPKSMVALDAVKLEKVGSTDEGAEQSEDIGNLLVASSKKDADVSGVTITEYEGTITLEQTLDVTAEDENGSLSEEEGVTVSQTVPFTIALPATSVHPNFLAGHAYQVKIYVYGLSLIKVTAELTPWEDGGGFEVTPEDQVNTGESATFTPTDDDLIAAWKFESTKLFNTLTGEKSFGEKSDTLLAYLASGYAISDEPITRAASTYTFKAFIEEFKAGEFEMTYFIDNGFTNENDEVTIESTISAKIEYTKNIQNGWVVRDRKTWEMLPSSYRENYVGYPAPADMPWLAVTFENLTADKVVVTTPSGVTVELSGENWTVTAENTLVTVKAGELKEVNTELPETFENGVYTITIGTKTWKIEYKAE